jgi:glutamate synthase (NADPH/NADH) large chain
MVELTPLDPADVAALQALLREHVQRTGSPKAQRILDGWDTLGGQFVKVYPSEYRRAMEAASSPATNSLAISELSPPDPGDLPVPVPVGEVL